jgi:hypothetical protein
MNIKFILVTLLLFLQLPLYAESAAAGTASFDSLFSAIYVLIRVVGFFTALLLAFLAIKKLVDYASDNRNPKNSPVSAIIMFFASGLLLNVDATLSMFINSLNDSGGYCFYGNTSGTENPFGNDSNCFTEAQTITKDLAQELQKRSENTESIEKLQEKLRMLFTLFQLVGLVYFIKGIYMLKAASEGAQQASYGKIIIMIIASAAVIDMPHTIDLLVNTISTWNKP